MKEDLGVLLWFLIIDKDRFIWKILHPPTGLRISLAITFQERKLDLSSYSNLTIQENFLERISQLISIYVLQTNVSTI